MPCQGCADEAKRAAEAAHPPHEIVLREQYASGYNAGIRDALRAVERRATPIPWAPIIELIGWGLLGFLVVRESGRFA